MASKIRDSLGHTDEENTEENSSASSSDEDDSRERGDGRSSGRASGDPRSSSKGSGRVSTRRATVKRAPNRAAVLQQNGTGSVEPVQIKAPGGTAEVGHLAEAIQKLGLRNSSSNNNNTPTGVRSRRQREQELRLEAENEQLLKRIIAQQSRVAELVSVGPGTLTRAHHVAPSAINRKRQQKYIHAQNLALHKRIEAARNGPVGGVSAASGITAALRAGSSRKPPRMPPLGLAQMPSRQRQDNR
ncbi:hypothetical protein BIW11_13999 [Tropilaelaps mercedesae]|uniref:Uncharacterized protein n=1 Tax=Tropilaelaps mercedesae TaxID=418985 RepID=A0A1V9WZE6_9ACAR|nr:hypothetical protein BIW11_13999 [Tropilaelaps mercedesae]